MTDERPTHLDIFSGIGGFALAAQAAGFRTVAFCEIDRSCSHLLGRSFPFIQNVGDVRRFMEWKHFDKIDLLTGGDPCPKHSRARSNGASNHPDLSGYFLAVAARFRPGWVVRENVPAPSVSHFSAGLEALGYRTITVRADADSFTAQSRQRDIIIGCDSLTVEALIGAFDSIAENGGRSYQTRLGTRQVAPALTCHRTRYDSRDCYIWDGKALRILESEERERLAGFPDNWTAEFSPATRAKMCGNAIVPQVAFEILKAIAETYQSLETSPELRQNV